MTLADIRIPYFLKQKEVDLVVDVGANAGQFGVMLFDQGYAGRVVSFEPLPDAHAQLVAAAQRQPRWIVAPRVALGATSGEAPLQIAGNSASSSLLAMKEAHVAAAPESRSIGTVQVEVRRLDEMMEVLNLSESKMFLKLDTQGTEYDVLLGASGTLERVVGIQVELSLVELYEAQPLFYEVDAYLRALGFELWDVIPIFRRQSGRLLQFDGVYFRN